MSAPSQRDQAMTLAKSSPAKALERARKIVEPWFRAQALARVARFTPGQTVPIAAEAARAARECDQAYQRAAVRAWEIAALTEAGALREASQALNAALVESRTITPLSSRSHALLLLAQAAASLDAKLRDQICEELILACASDSDWRNKRAVRDARALRNGTMPPRPFFW